RPWLANPSPPGRRSPPSARPPDPPPTFAISLPPDPPPASAISLPSKPSVPSSMRYRTVMAALPASHAAADDPSLSNPCHPTLSISRTISFYHFSHSTPQRHHGRPCQQLTRQRPALQQAKPICIRPPRPTAHKQNSSRPNPASICTIGPPSSATMAAPPCSMRPASSRPAPITWASHEATPPFPKSILDQASMVTRAPSHGSITSTSSRSIGVHTPAAHDPCIIRPHSISPSQRPCPNQWPRSNNP
ncbi:hypothetical protein ACLOJK_040473, partial [Asimina triloba]